MSDFIDDILEQPRLLETALRTHLEPGSALDQAVGGIMQMRPRRIILTGMGSSLFASYPAWLRLIDAGLGAIWVELSELLHYAAGQIGPDTLLVVVSQSGETVEALRLLEAGRTAGSVLAITNNTASSLARHARWVIPSLAGPERTIATKTYTMSLLALTLLAERLAGATPRGLAATFKPAVAAAEQVCADAPAQIAALPEAWLTPAPLTLVGRGPSLATALSGGLLLKETAKIPAEGMSSAQFRHGPMEISGPSHRAIICTAPGPTLALGRKLAAELHVNGSLVLLLGPDTADLPGVDTIPLPETAATGLYALIPLQLYARELAIRQGITPGSFRYITKVTAEE